MKKVIFSILFLMGLSFSQAHATTVTVLETHYVYYCPEDGTTRPGPVIQTPVNPSSVSEPSVLGLVGMGLLAAFFVKSRLKA